MSNDKVKETGILKQSFLDISRGYSKFILDDKIYFLKHIGFEDNVTLDSYQEELDSLATKLNIPEEKDRLDFLSRKKLWTNDDEKKLKDQKSYLVGLEANKTKAFLASQMEYMEKTIDATRKEVNELWAKRYYALDITAERFIDERLNRYLIYSTLYTDSTLSHRSFATFEDFEDLDEDTLYLFTILYNQESNKTGISNIKKIIVSDFFSPYFIIFMDDITSIFKGVISNGPLALTYNQVHFIINYRYFKNIFQNNKIPDDIRNNPEEIEKYITLSNNNKEIIQKQADKGGYTVMAGKRPDSGDKSIENDKLVVAMKNKPISGVIEASRIMGD